MYKDIIDTIGFVESYDPELGAAMQRRKREGRMFPCLL